MRTRTFRFLPLLLAFAAAPLAAQGLPGLPPERLEQVEEALVTHMARERIPGLSIAIATERQLRWTNGYGLADVENALPARASTVYRLASISKPVTAVAALHLYERGQLDLDADVRRYVSEFPEKPWPVTARQLLCHQGGIRHYRGDEINSDRRYTNLTAPLAIFADDDLLFEPGTRFSYTTYGYNLLGAAVEGAAETGFLDYLQEHVFRPAGTQRLRDDDQRALIPNRAQGYTLAPSGGWRNARHVDTSNKIPGGGMVGTAADLARFAVALQSGTLLRPETAQLMFTDQRTRAGETTGYGLGWRLASQGGRREVYHTGGQPRVATVLYMLPDEGVTVAIMTNLQGSGPLRLAREIAGLFVD